MTQQNKPRIVYLEELGIYKLYGELKGRRLNLEDEPWHFNTKKEALVSLSLHKQYEHDTTRTRV